MRRKNAITTLHIPTGAGTPCPSRALSVVSPLSVSSRGPRSHRQPVIRWLLFRFAWLASKEKVWVKLSRKTVFLLVCPSSVPYASCVRSGFKLRALSPQHQISITAPSYPVHNSLTASHFCSIATVRDPAPFPLDSLPITYFGLIIAYELIGTFPPELAGASGVRRGIGVHRLIGLAQTMSSFQLQVHPYPNTRLPPILSALLQ